MRALDRALCGRGGLGALDRALGGRGALDGRSGLGGRGALDRGGLGGRAKTSVHNRLKMTGSAASATVLGNTSELFDFLRSFTTSFASVLASHFNDGSTIFLFIIPMTSLCTTIFFLL